MGSHAQKDLQSSKALHANGGMSGKITSPLGYTVER